ncbi:sensor histidine kinase [Microlunatus parietis]|uniref:Oxygen sensor histidine kinase NreB n=1 Tax=Microlunatus parietis TaxID=682979 RepID=A0A7Y9LAU6_9ACTN|nr:sensor histidine kinase [Microlunatus parietis]NYE69960.1 signal transduction histidine kinase [Microlunatus parietis]
MALLGLYAWYRGYGRRHLGPDARNVPVLFTVVTLVIFAAGLAFQPMIPVGWGLVFPMVFLGCRLRVAVIFAAVSAALPSIMLVLRAGPEARFLPTSLIMGLAVGGSAILLGLWIGQMMEQSNQRAQLIEQLEASREQVELLSREAGIATERTRLAGEIHDTLAQGFTSIVTLVQAAESELEADLPAARRHLALATETARENLAEARAMVATLTPSPLASGTLAEAIRRRADLVGAQTSAEVTVRLQDIDGLSTAVEVVLLRSAQEALANIGKHAGARQVTVELSETADTVRLSVTDDGTGFDPEEPRSGFGLAGMRKRAEDIGGTLRLDSRPGAGTTVTVEVPW